MGFVVVDADYFIFIAHPPLVVDSYYIINIAFVFFVYM